MSGSRNRPASVRGIRHVKPVAATTPGRRARGLAALWGAVVLLLGIIPAPAAGGPAPVKLKPRTLEAFERYAGLTEARNAEELRRGTAFLWVDGLAPAEREAAYAALRRGQVRIERLETRENGRAIACPDGIVHHWVGVIYIPGATLEETLRLLQDYDHHSAYYRPDVQRSNILERQGNDFKVYMRFLRKKGITVVLNTEHEIHYFPLEATRAHSRSRATRIAEVEDHGRPEEREKPVDDGGGYLWRMETWWRFLERDGGTYVQCETVTLTRDIPTGLGWLIRPFLSGIPRETLTKTLTDTRAALARKPAGSPAP